jgi:hypothetical protein
MIGGSVHVTARDGPVSMDRLMGILTALKKTHVYVGIPEEKAGRRSGEVTNAQLLFIHTNGSPLRRIPKRPVIEPALATPETQARIQALFKACALAALANDPEKAVKNLKKVGIVGADASKKWFTDGRNSWPPNKPATIRRKLAKLRGRRKQAALAAFAAGAANYEFNNTTYGVNTVLVDTAQMRNAITYVIRDFNEIETVFTGNETEGTA